MTIAQPTSLFSTAELLAAARCGLPAPARRHVHGGQALVLAGAPTLSLFVVRSGTFKSVFTTADGDERVTAFHRRGDLAGTDALVARKHVTSIVAVEDSQAWGLPLAVLRNPSVPHLAALLWRVLAAQIVHEQRVAEVLSERRGHERVAAFLLDLASSPGRFDARADDLRLPMPQADIASYLGLAVGTISRSLSLFARRHVIAVRQHRVRILDQPALERDVTLPPHVGRPLHRPRATGCAGRPATGSGDAGGAPAALPAAGAPTGSG